MSAKIEIVVCGLPIAKLCRRLLSENWPTQSQLELLGVGVEKSLRLADELRQKRAKKNVLARNGLPTTSSSAWAFEHLVDCFTGGKAERVSQGVR